jgi:integrase
MGKIRLSVPRLHIVGDRFYWRPTASIKALGFSYEALGKDPMQAAARARALNEQVERAKMGLDHKAKREDTVSALIDAYQSCPRYKSRAETTRKGYDHILKHIRIHAGHVVVATIDRPGLLQTYQNLIDAKGLFTANAYMKVWQIILKHAYDLGWRKENPASGLGLQTPPPRDQVWSVDQVLRFCDAALAMGKPSMRLAILLAYDLGQRPGDYIKLSWTAYNGRGFAIKQSKTKQRVIVPFENPFLWAEIDAMPRAGSHVLICEGTKEPYQPDYFRHLCIKIRRAAKLPEHLQFRDLRRTAATEWGAAGATDDQIRGGGGWKTRNQVSTYVVPSEASAGGAQAKRRANR